MFIHAIETLFLSMNSLSLSLSFYLIISFDWWAQHLIGCHLPDSLVSRGEIDKVSTMSCTFVHIHMVCNEVQQSWPLLPNVDQSAVAIIVDQCHNCILLIIFSTIKNWINVLKVFVTSRHILFNPTYSQKMKFHKHKNEITKGSRNGS